MPDGLDRAVLKQEGRMRKFAHRRCTEVATHDRNARLFNPSMSMTEKVASSWLGGSPHQHRYFRHCRCLVLQHHCMVCLQCRWA